MTIKRLEEHEKLSQRNNFAVKNMQHLIDILGWLGAGLVLLAYYWSSVANVLETQQKYMIYQVINIVGASGLVINSFYYGAAPSVILNLIWACIGMFATLKMRWAQQKIKGHTAMA